MDGKKIEKIERAIGVMVIAPHIAKPLVISRGGIQLLCAAFMMLGCLFVGLFVFDGANINLLGQAFIILLFSWLIAAQYYSWANIGKPLIRVDDQGVAYCSWFGLQSKIAKWNEIESCEVVRVLDVFGKEIQHFLVVNEFGGKKFIVTLFNIHDLNRVADFLKSVLSGDAQSTAPTG